MPPYAELLLTHPGLRLIDPARSEADVRDELGTMVATVPAPAWNTRTPVSGPELPNPHVHRCEYCDDRLAIGSVAWESDTAWVEYQCCVSCEQELLTLGHQERAVGSPEPVAVGLPWVYPFLASGGLLADVAGFGFAEEAAAHCIATVHAHRRATQQEALGVAA